MNNFLNNNINYNNISELKSNLNDALTQCIKACNETSSYIFDSPDISLRVNQLKRLRDCAEACIATSIIFNYNSIFSKEQVELCGKFCEACAIECLKFSDIQSQQCARVCYMCAKMCKQYSYL